jgi:transposase-like protein
MPKEDEQRRQRAIDRYLAGDPSEDICRELACSKSWLYKWRDRYQATAPSWSEALRRNPRTTPTKTPTRIAQAVVSLRHTLAQHGKSCGAAAIKQAFEQQGREPVPSRRTIYRILHRDAKEVT